MAPKHYNDDIPVPGVYAEDMQNGVANPYAYLYFKNGGQVKKKIRKATDGAEIEKVTRNDGSGGDFIDKPDVATQARDFIAGNILNIAELGRLLKTKHDSRKVRDYDNEMYDSYELPILSPLHNFSYHDNGLMQQKNAAVNEQLNNI